MEIKISQNWLDRRPISTPEWSALSGPMMSLEELDSRGNELIQEYITQAPAIEIRRRGWLDSYLESTKSLTSNAIYEAFSNLISAHTPTMALQALLRESSNVAQGELWRGLTTKLWLANAATLAMEQEIPGFRQEALDQDSITELVQLSRLDNGPALARDWLHNAGIHLIISNPLPTMRLDGATLMLENGRPLISLTLRFDRLDSFWFTLLHEIGHIKRHLMKDSSLAFLDDLEDVNATDELEAEADAFARNSAIPRDIWRRSDAHRHSTKASVLELANQLQIHPAIPAGRLRFETNNYTIFPELVGYDQVRRHLLG